MVVEGAYCFSCRKTRSDIDPESGECCCYVCPQCDFTNKGGIDNIECEVCGASLDGTDTETDSGLKRSNHSLDMPPGKMSRETLSPSMSCVSSSSSLSSFYSASTFPLPTDTDFSKTNWLWAHSNLGRGPQGARQQRKSDGESSHEDTMKVVDALLNSYRQGQSVDPQDVNKGALGSQDLFNLASVLVNIYAHASRSGKWLLFISRERIDEIWGEIKSAVEDGKLGPTAKIGISSGVFFLVCIYTDDFTDRADITRILNQLIDMKLIHRKKITSYKADLVTLMGVEFNGNTNSDNGTWWSGKNVDGEGVVVHPEHFNANNGQGKKFVMKGRNMG